MVFEHPHRTQRCQRSCWLRENFKDSCGWRATERGPKDQFVADTARKRHLQAHGRQIPAHSLPGLEADSVVAGPQPFWYFFACSEPPELRFLGRWYFLSFLFSTTIQRKIRNICPFLGGPLPPFFPFHPWVYKIANLKRSRFCRSAGVPWRELTDVSALHVLPSGFRPSGNGQRGGVGLRFFCDIITIIYCRIVSGCRDPGKINIRKSIRQSPQFQLEKQSSQHEHHNQLKFFPRPTAEKRSS